MSRRFALRDATHHIHERLDRTVGDLGDLPAYATYLVALAGFREAAEGALATAAWPSGWLFRPTLIGPELRADLDDLGLRPAASPVVLAAPESPSDLLGMLYVLEGSNFGAKLLRQRAIGLGLGDGHGARHLCVMAATGGAWRGLLSALDAEPSFDAVRAHGTAAATFAAALRSFEGAIRVEA